MEIDDEEDDIIVDLNKLPQLKPALDRLKKRKALSALPKSGLPAVPSILSCGEDITKQKFFYDAMFKLVRDKGFKGTWNEYQVFKKEFEEYIKCPYPIYNDKNKLILFKALASIPKGKEVKIFNTKKIIDPVECIETIIASIQSVIENTSLQDNLTAHLVTNIIVPKVINKLVALKDQIEDKICNIAFDQHEKKQKLI